MVVWSEKLYFGEGVKKKHRKIIRAINKGKLSYGIYIISYASNAENLFDIISVQELQFPAYKNMEIHIVGLANGKDEAIGLVTNMLMEIYLNTGDFKVRDYF